MGLPEIEVAHQVEVSGQAQAEAGVQGAQVEAGVQAQVEVVHQADARVCAIGPARSENSPPSDGDPFVRA